MHRFIRYFVDQFGQIGRHDGIGHLRVPVGPSVIAQIGGDNVILFRQSPGDGRPVPRLTEKAMDNHDGAVVTVFFAKGVMG